MITISRETIMQAMAAIEIRLDDLTYGFADRNEDYYKIIEGYQKALTELKASVNETLNVNPRFQQDTD